MKQNFVLYFLSTVFLAVIFFLQFITGNVSINMDFMGWSFYTLSCISHAAMVMLIPFLLIGIPTALICSQKNKTGILIYAFFCSLFIILAVLDGLVFSLYKFHINGFVLGMVFGENAGQIFSFDTALVIKSSLIGLFIIALCMVLALVAKAFTKRSESIHAKLLISVLLIATLFAQGIHIYGAAVRSKTVMKSCEYLPYYFPLSANRFMIKLGVIDPTIVNRMKISDNSSDILYPLHPLEYNDSISKPNVIFILIDAWNYRTYTEACTPNIAKFGQKSKYFANHFSCSNGTTSAVFGLYTGISAYYWVDFELAGKSPILIDRMSDLGYNIQMFPSATICNPPFNKVLFHKLDHIYTSTEGETTYDRDCQITHNFASYLDTIDTSKPFFSWLFYDLAHSCRLPNDKFKRFQPSWDFADYTALNNDADPEPFFNLYRNCVAHVDSLVGIVLNTLEKKDLLKNTIVIITGDHGQEFNENHKNFWGHNGNFSRAQIGVPFIYYEPQITPDTVNYRSTHYDISATILKKLGVKNPTSDFSMGHCLDDSISRDWLVVGSRDNYAFIHNNQILEKRPTGVLEATNPHLDPIPDSEIDFQALNNALIGLNKYYK